eukprot:TRINITY_DN4917_c0_g1_i1.p1 TRINITY_DN4917_c0_g1~~TRINITY_DN4917_c0_g1_i1.p1  ORF type:complete len:414 (+),score=63.63 TRINITY_DN4917_c0_g1_i1:44-1285(+)
MVLLAASTGAAMASLAVRPNCFAADERCLGGRYMLQQQFQALRRRVLGATTHLDTLRPSAEKNARAMRRRDTARLSRLRRRPYWRRVVEAALPERTQIDDSVPASYYVISAMAINQGLRERSKLRERQRRRPPPVFASAAHGGLQPPPPAGAALLDAGAGEAVAGGPAAERLAAIARRREALRRRREARAGAAAVLAFQQGRSPPRAAEEVTDSDSPRAPEGLTGAVQASGPPARHAATPGPAPPRPPTSVRCAPPRPHSASARPGAHRHHLGPTACSLAPEPPTYLTDGRRPRARASPYLQPTAKLPLSVPAPPSAPPPATACSASQQLYPWRPHAPAAASWESVDKRPAPPPQYPPQQHGGSHTDRGGVPAPPGVSPPPDAWTGSKEDSVSAVPSIPVRSDTNSVPPPEQT